MSSPNLTITAAAEDRRLTQLARVKTELGIGHSGDDPKLRRLILAVSMAFTGPEGLAREPWLQSYQEKRPGNGGHYLFVSRWPLLGDPSSVQYGTGASPDTVDATTYSVAGRDRDRLYRELGWAQTDTDSQVSSPGSRTLIYTLAYTAGWVLPSQVTTWVTATAVAANAWVRATGDDEGPLIFRAGGAGTTGGSEPTWPTAPGGTVTDNGITWTAHEQELPQDLEEAAIAQVAEWYNGGIQVPAGIKSEAGEGWRREYREELSGSLSPAVRMILGRYR